MKSTRASLLFSVLSLGGLGFSLPANSLVLDYNEHSHSVTAGGLEWLRWDATAGMSISQAKSHYAGDGWRLASDDEMAGLFEELGLNYHLGDYASVDRDENTGQVFWDESASTQFYSLLETFGVTSAECYDRFYPEVQCITGSSALYGTDADGDQLYGAASVSYSEWHDAITGEWVWYSEAWAELGSDSYSSGYASAGGVALVRDVTAVPLPPSVSLFAGALAALAWFQRRRWVKR